MSRPASRGERPRSEFVLTQHLPVSDNSVKNLLGSAIDGDGYPHGYHKLTHWLRRKRAGDQQEARLWALPRDGHPSSPVRTTKLSSAHDASVVQRHSDRTER